MIAEQIKERPIPFKGEMVRAILEGRKTQTRRLVKLPLIDRLGPGCEIAGCEVNSMLREGRYDLCPYGVPGERLWVRERVSIGWHDGGCLAVDYHADGSRWVIENPNVEQEPYCAKYINDDKRPSIFMPRWASRITLEIIGVRVERLQDISEEDAKAEGIRTYGEWMDDDRRRKYNAIMRAYGTSHYQTGFRLLWDSINGKTCPWDSNPWVWVIEFLKVEEK